MVPLSDQYYSVKVRGNGANDVFVVGDFGYCLHFNGERWSSYPELTNFDAAYGGLSVKGNTICAVGYSTNGNGTYAIITLGRRN